MRQLVATLAAVTVMAGAGSACATKKFVRGQVDDVNGRVETLGQSLEATQQQTKEGRSGNGCRKDGSVRRDSRSGSGGYGSRQGQRR